MRTLLKLPFLFLAFLVPAAVFAAPGDDSPVVTNGSFHTVKRFRSDVFGNTRTLVIHLPATYAVSNRKSYPVVFMDDGNTVFHFQNPSESWEADTVSDRLAAEGRIRECIIVGVFTPERGREYATESTDRYASLLGEEILPWLSNRYRILGGPSNTVIIGSSAGGANAFNLGWYHPELFGMAGCMSPSFWWDNYEFLSRVESGEKKDVKYWIDSGNFEFEDRKGAGLSYFADAAYDVTSALLGKGWTFGKDLLFNIGWNDPHNGKAWARRLERPFLFFIGTGAAPKLTNLSVRTTTDVLDRTGTTPYMVLVIDAQCDNGSVVTIPPELCRISSSRSNWYRMENNRIYLEPKAKWDTDVLDFRVGYRGLTAEASVRLAEKSDGGVLLNIEVAAPADSPDVIYAGGVMKELGGWNLSECLPLYLRGSEGAMRIFTNSVQVHRNSISDIGFLSGRDYQDCEASVWYDADGIRRESDTRSRFIRAREGTNTFHATIGKWAVLPK